MTTHSRILAWRIPWIEEPGGLQSTGLQRVGHNLMTEQQQKFREPTDQCRPVEQGELTILVTENSTDQFNPGSSPYRPVLVSDKQAVF